MDDSFSTVQGGAMTLPVLTQIVYLDFDGELTKYRNQDLNLDIDVTVEDSRLSPERIKQITDSLNEQYASQNVRFVTERPEGTDYSTIYVGKTSSFSRYGTFAGLAEAIDSGNQNQSDNAFVILDSTSDNAQIISTISHELDHLLGTLDHGGDGLERYASGIRYDVSSGVTSTGIVLTNDSMYVSNGGMANSTTLNVWGHMFVSSGGTANSTTVNSYGGLYVFSGGIANSTTVNSGGWLHVSSGGTANSTTVNSYGGLYVFSGGTALNVVNHGRTHGIVIGGDTATVLKGINADGKSFYISNGIASNISGSLEIKSGGVANSTTVNAGGDLDVSSGGIANSATINEKGELDVHSGGVANSTTVNGGELYVYNGGTANGTTLNGSVIASIMYYAYLYVSSGGVANNTTVNYHGGLYVSSGGVANSTTVNSYGSLDVDSGGVANSATINEKGELYVHSGGVANSTTVNSGGDLDVWRGGTANSTTVTYEGELDVHSGGVANSTTVNGGELFVSSGGTANSTTVNGGELFVSRGGTANGTTVNDGGDLYVYSGGTALAIVENGGCVYVYDNASATFIANSFSGLVLSGYGSATLHSGTTANSTTVNSGGSLYVYSGGTANGTTVNSSGWLYVKSGGVANSTIFMSGTQGVCVYSGGLLISNTVLSGANVGLVGNMSASVVSAGGTLNALGGCEPGSIGLSALIDSTSVYGNFAVQGGCKSNAFATADHTDVYSGGKMTVLSGCSALNTNIYSGGSMLVDRGCTASNTVADGGVMRVEGGASAVGITAKDKGIVKLIGDTEDITVTSGGAVFVLGGAEAENITVTGGGVYVATGGEIKGSISVSQEGKLYLYGGSIVNGEIHVKGLLSVDEDMVSNGHITISLNEESASAAMIENLDCLCGTGNFTVDSSAVGLGTYSLASGAENYDGSITIVDDGTELGELSVGETLTHDGIHYTLTKTDSSLSLLKAVVVTAPAMSDVDGSGVSDVVFQWTGGDYQIGFWMNGTNAWQGQGIGQPSNWELIGAYDMDQNGKADLVMRGNIQIGEDKGAYIGYYKDGDVTQWQNISFLNNPYDIDWKLAVGNVTGNDNCNSIVWHAPELGALGVWTDGTANWVSLAGGFDSNWTMLGCGDFDGNGKDEVLFSHAGDLYTTDIDQKFASLGGWGVEWEVKAIGDFAGDGKDDIIVQNGNIIAKFKDGKAESWESVGVMDASDWFICGTGDYNGDQQDDLLVRQYSTGMLGYYESGDMSQWIEMGRGVDMNWSVIA